MQSEIIPRDRLLIVDDSLFNCKVLRTILEEKYDVEEVHTGEEALDLLSKRSHDFQLVLLDLVMPGMGGFGLLEYMNKYRWIEDLPVIMVSSETDAQMVKRAYSMGITDFIRRPYEPDIVLQRIRNTIQLYAKQRRMMRAVAEKYYENERHSNLMISILSNIVEFRNGESGLHILHIKKITWFLLHKVLDKAGPQTYRVGDIPMLCKAAALHDIGKIAIPDSILNKPGRLTDEEFEIMKGHSRFGADMLKDLFDAREPLVKASYEICRWHHERWDGNGYPDGLAGDEIPIHAQVVALADVYDALTSERCYKPAYSHEKAISMILNGECGVFNPVLLDCMKDVEQELKEMVEHPVMEEVTMNPEEMLENVSRHDDMVMTRDLVHRVAVAQEKVEFLFDHIGEPCFFYCCEPSVITFSKKAQERFNLKDTYVEPEHQQEILNRIGYSQALRIRAYAYTIPREHGDYGIQARIQVDGEDCDCLLCCRNIWLVSPPTLCGVIGIIRKDPHPELHSPDPDSGIKFT